MPGQPSPAVVRFALAIVPGPAPAQECLLGSAPIRGSFRASRVGPYLAWVSVPARACTR